MNIDPLAEKFMDMSPFVYGMNNPIYFIDPDGMASDGWIRRDENGETSMTYDPNVNNINEANAAGYTKVVSVSETAKISSTSGSYSYDLNADGSVTNSSDGSNIMFHKPITEGGATVGGAFQTAQGTRIYTPNIGDGFSNLPKHTGAVTPMDFSSPFFMGAGIAKSFFGNASKSVAPDLTTVGRWMSQSEYSTMSATSQMVEGAGGQTFVATGGPSSFTAAARGSVYAEFQVPTNSLLQGGQANWFKTIGPNAGKAMQSSLQKQGGQLLPPIQNLSPILKVK